MRGGKRKNQTGRPKNVEPTKAIRLPESIANKAKSGYYEAIDSLIQDWIYRQQDHHSKEGGTTRDWTRADEMIEEFLKLKESYKDK